MGTDEKHRTLEARAALAGMSLSEFVLRELRRVAERPSPEELRRRIASRRPVSPSTAPATLLRREREAHLPVEHYPPSGRRD